MMKRHAGQAFILVLILLAIGAMLVVPALRLTGTSLKSGQIVTRQARLLYAADAMQEYVMWKLLYDTGWRDADLSEDGATAYLNLDLCGVSVSATVVMRAVPGKGGVTLSTDDVMKPTKTVSPSSVPNGSYQTFTYIIRLEQLSNNTTQGLDAVYDILPKVFGTGKYVANSSYISVDGGAWQSIGNPSTATYGGQERLRWPASGSFTSLIRDFNVRQVKELKFQIALTLPSSANDNMLYNYCVIKVGSVTTFSGPQAPIKLGNGSKPDADGMLTLTKTSSPSVIMPGVIQDITYTMYVSNNDTSNHNIEKITDYLPPEFFYTNNSTIGFGNANPTTTMKNINGVNRQELVWVPVPAQKQLNAGQTRTLTFCAETTKDVSGSYYNEVLMQSDFNLPAIYSDIGVTSSDFQSGYSWNSGTVIVPAYDSSANAEGVVIDANLALKGLSSISITSYQIR